MKNNVSKKIVMGVVLLIVTSLLVFVVYSNNQGKAPRGYVEIEGYNDPSPCLAMIPECGVCMEEYGGFKLIDGKCYGLR